MVIAVSEKCQALVIIGNCFAKREGRQGRGGIAKMRKEADQGGREREVDRKRERVSCRVKESAKRQEYRQNIKANFMMQLK